ncbi:MAG: DUF357 domain-containing protein [Candidatus Nanoarchaeia archaeon]
MEKDIKERLEKYLKLTDKALKQVKNTEDKQAKILIDMAERYYKDALHFKEKQDYINAFAAVNYAHAFLDSAVLLGLIKVDDNTLFMTD